MSLHRSLSAEGYVARGFDVVREAFADNFTCRRDAAGSLSREHAMTARTKGAFGVAVMGAMATAVAFAVLGGTSAHAQSPAIGDEAGSSLFRTYCAACHGTSARGDGPLADSMRRRPPDLTTIGKREGGTFPADKVFRIIDGRQKVAGHGGPDMPVWGDVFNRVADSNDEGSVKLRIEQLVRYLESIQERGTRD
jgi:mono/diheme cytochrome c family protein